MRNPAGRIQRSSRGLTGGNIHIVDQPGLAEPGCGEHAALLSAAPQPQRPALASFDIIDLLETGRKQGAAGFACRAVLVGAGRQRRGCLAQDHVEPAGDLEFGLAEIGVTR